MLDITKLVKHIQSTIGSFTPNSMLALASIGMILLVLFFTYFALTGLVLYLIADLVEHVSQF